MLVPVEEYRKLTRPPRVPPLPEPDANGNYPALAAAEATIARTIVQRREAAGMTQKQLADSAGIRVEVLNRAERGAVVPSVKTLSKIEAALKKAQARRKTR